MADREVAGRPDSGAPSPGLASGTGADTLGEALSRARQRRGLTVQQISATTKIPVRHLEALERNDIRAVPGGMYLRAEIRAYADVVGLERSVALGYLQAALDPHPPVADAAPARAPEAEPPALRRSALVRGLMVAGCVVAAAAVVMWRMDRETARTPPAVVGAGAPPAAEQVSTVPEPVESAPVAATNTAPLPAVVPAPAGDTSGTTGSASVPAAASPVTTTDQPAEPALTGPELQIVTEPAGARVTIDGVGWGVTPVTIRYLPPGIKQLRITKDGFVAEDRVIRFDGGPRRTSVRIDLRQTGDSSARPLAGSAIGVSQR